MNRRQFLTISSIILAGALGACGAPGGQSQGLAQQFLTERNGGTPVAIGAGGPNAPVVGAIEAIDGRTLTVKRPMDGSTATIQLAEGATIRKDIEAQLSEITAGDRVTAFGSRQNEVFQAELLQLGAEADADDEPLVMSFSGADGKAPASGQDQFTVGSPSGALPQPISGVVESIDGRRLVLTEHGGASTSVTLADNAKIQKSAEVAPSDLTAGTMIMAKGTYEGEVFQATQLRVLSSPKAP
ncbi:MAG TPA: DUF5666 domain-containing protein [Roseiflexaceae bacterium]|nr:DUF5666 domain-containing protein [Roseiflexaceae bacterium]